MIQNKVLYPFILCFYFVSFIFAENLGQVYLGDAVRPIVVVLLVAGTTLLLFRVIFRSFDRAAFVTTLLLTLIFIYAGLARLMAGLLGKNMLVLFAAEIVALGVIGFITLRTVTDWKKLNQTLNLITGVLLAMALYRIGSYGMSDEGVIIAPPVERQAVSVEGFERPAGKLPNIYYLLVDGYTRSDTLQDYFGYDNTDFLGYLRDTGFKVADKSVANYNLTAMALSSQLNMEYLGDEDGFKEAHPKGSAHLIDEKIFNNRVAAVLKNLGYRVITLRSNYKFVVTRDAENLILDDGGVELSAFESALLKTTVLPRISGKFGKEVFSKRDKVEFVLDSISQRAAEPDPTFLIAHIMVPHHPFIFDRNGELPDQEAQDFGMPANLSDDVRGYADQVHYLNGVLRNLIDDILANSEIPPIIILQGDHGLRLTWWEKMQLDEQEQLEDVCLREVFTNLNALYLPDEEHRGAFYDSISPINTFRLIFDAYFGSEMGMLEDRSFFTNLKLNTKREKRSMSFIEVTGRQDTCPASWDEKFRALH
jgi:hypothetical protein